MYPQYQGAVYVEKCTHIMIPGMQFILRNVHNTRVALYLKKCTLKEKPW